MKFSHEGPIKPALDKLIPVQTDLKTVMDGRGLLDNGCQRQGEFDVIPPSDRNHLPELFPCREHSSHQNPPLGFSDTEELGGACGPHSFGIGNIHSVVQDVIIPSCTDSKRASLRGAFGLSCLCGSYSYME